MGELRVLPEGTENRDIGTVWLERGILSLDGRNSYAA